MHFVIFFSIMDMHDCIVCFLHSLYWKRLMLRLMGDSSQNPLHTLMGDIRYILSSTTQEKHGVGMGCRTLPARQSPMTMSCMGVTLCDYTAMCLQIHAKHKGVTSLTPSLQLTWGVMFLWFKYALQLIHNINLCKTISYSFSLEAEDLLMPSLSFLVINQFT